MQFSTIITYALAALTASAAPAPEKRAQFDVGALNNLAFNSLDVNYLNVINSVDLNQLQGLAVNNNLNVLAFTQVFQSNVFDVNTIMQLQQLQTVLALNRAGVFASGVDLSGLNLAALNLGLVSNVGAFDLGSVIDVNVVPQIQTVVQNGIVVA